MGKSFQFHSTADLRFQDARARKANWSTTLTSSEEVCAPVNITYA